MLEDDSRLVDRAVRLLSQLETGEVDGEPLRQMAATGDLSDCRKLYFGLGAPGSHQIVYREVGEETVEVLEVIAVEAREELYAYLLTAQRLGSSDR